MAKTYTAVPSVTAGSVYTAANYNTYTATNVSNLIVPPSLVISRVANQSVANTAWTFTSFDTKTTDTDGMAASIPSDTKVTVQTAGLYQITSWVSFAANATGVRALILEKNAASASSGTRIAAVANAAIATYDQAQTLSMIANLAVSDTLHLSVFQTSGGAVNTTMFLSATWIGRTS